MLDTIAKKIGFGYLCVMAILIVSGILVSIETASLSRVNAQIRDLRMPTVQASYTILNGVNESQAATRAWLLTGERRFLEQRDSAWRDDIDRAVAKLSALESRFVHQETRQYVNETREMLKNLRANQEYIEKQRVSRTTLAEEISNRLTATDLRLKVEQLARFQQRLMDEEAEAQAALILRMNHLQLLLIGIGALACLGMAALVIRAVVTPINRTIEFAHAISEGDYERKIEIRGSVEIDRLGAALEKMRSGLELQTWLSRSQLQFLRSIQKAQTARELASRGIEALARLTRASVGVLHLSDGHRLRVVGGFAVPGGIGERETKIGNSIAGQAAQDRQVVVVKDPSGGELPIASSLGDFRPREIVAAPLVHQDEVIGVIELGSLETSRPRDGELLKMVSDAMAVSLDAVLKGDQVRNLLHETQSQSEELQAQQEELRQSNDELQARQEELESINEELEEQQQILRQQKEQLDEKNGALGAAQAALSARAEELERVGRYKSEFLANMSHELRTPLNSQLILSKILAENKEGNLSAKQIQFAETIHGTGLDLLNLINDILDLSKVEAGKLDLEVREVPLEEFVAGLQRDFAMPLEQRGLSFRVEIDPEAPAVIATDSLRLGQVLRNLLSNAMKFTEKGEVSLRVAPVREGERRGGVAFLVRDTGIGIPVEKQKLIFDAFEQVDSATTRKYGGTGLGLAISVKLSALLGGDIKLESKSGEGSLFTLSVPAVAPVMLPSGSERNSADAPAAKVEVDSRAGKPVSPGPARRILVVEDDPILQRQLADLLSEAKFEAVVAATGSAAGDRLGGGECFDCLILDLNLPDTTGFELLKKIRKNHARSSLPVIVYTARDLTRPEEEELRRDSDAIIIKGARSGERLLDEVSLFVHRLGRELPKSREPVKTSRSYSGQKILIVDDDVRNIFALTSALEEKALSVVIARDGAEALARLAEHPDTKLVLMDIMMPVMDGLEATRKIKADVRTRAVPVIALTAKAMKEDKEQCLAAGASDYLPKPIDTDRLLTLLDVWLTETA